MSNIKLKRITIPALGQPGFGKALGEQFANIEQNFQKLGGLGLGEGPEGRSATYITYNLNAVFVYAEAFSDWYDKFKQAHPKMEGVLNQIEVEVEKDWTDYFNLTGQNKTEYTNACANLLWGYMWNSLTPQVDETSLTGVVYAEHGQNHNPASFTKPDGSIVEYYPIWCKTWLEAQGTGKQIVRDELFKDHIEYFAPGRVMMAVRPTAEISGSFSSYEPIGSLAYVFIDPRFRNKYIGSDLGTMTDGAEDVSCVLYYIEKEGFKLVNLFPQMYIEDGQLYWKINGHETNIPVTGPQGVPGESSTFVIVEREENVWVEGDEKGLWLPGSEDVLNYISSGRTDLIAPKYGYSDTELKNILDEYKDGIRTWYAGSSDLTSKDARYLYRVKKVIGGPTLDQDYIKTLQGVPCIVLPGETYRPEYTVTNFWFSTLNVTLNEEGEYQLLVYCSPEAGMDKAIDEHTFGGMMMAMDSYETKRLNDRRNKVRGLMVPIGNPNIPIDDPNNPNKPNPNTFGAHIITSEWDDEEKKYQKVTNTINESEQFNAAYDKKILHIGSVADYRSLNYINTIKNKNAPAVPGREDSPFYSGSALHIDEPVRITRYRDTVNNTIPLLISEGDVVIGPKVHYRKPDNSQASKGDVDNLTRGGLIVESTITSKPSGGLSGWSTGSTGHSIEFGKPTFTDDINNTFDNVKWSGLFYRDLGAQRLFTHQGLGVLDSTQKELVFSVDKDGNLQTKGKEVRSNADDTLWLFHSQLMENLGFGTQILKQSNQYISNDPKNPTTTNINWKSVRHPEDSEGIGEVALIAASEPQGPAVNFGFYDWKNKTFVTNNQYTNRFKAGSELVFKNYADTVVDEGGHIIKGTNKLPVSINATSPNNPEKGALVNFGLQTTNAVYIEGSTQKVELKDGVLTTSSAPIPVGSGVNDGAFGPTEISSDVHFGPNIYPGLVVKKGILSEGALVINKDACFGRYVFGAAFKRHGVNPVAPGLLLDNGMSTAPFYHIDDERYRTNNSGIEVDGVKLCYKGDLADGKVVLTTPLLSDKNEYSGKDLKLKRYGNNINTGRNGNKAKWDAADKDITYNAVVTSSRTDIYLGIPMEVYRVQYRKNGDLEKSDFWMLPLIPRQLDKTSTSNDQVSNIGQVREDFYIKDKEGNDWSQRMIIDLNEIFKGNQHYNPPKCFDVTFSALKIFEKEWTGKDKEQQYGATFRVDTDGKVYLAHMCFPGISSDLYNINSGTRPYWNVHLSWPNSSNSFTPGENAKDYFYYYKLYEEGEEIKPTISSLNERNVEDGQKRLEVYKDYPYLYLYDLEKTGTTYTAKNPVLIDNWYEHIKEIWWAFSESAKETEKGEIIPDWSSGQEPDGKKVDSEDEIPAATKTQPYIWIKYKYNGGTDSGWELYDEYEYDVVTDLESKVADLETKTDDLETRQNDTDKFVSSHQQRMIFNGHGFVNMNLPSGTLWATCNVGAGTPGEYGDIFAWGETKGYNFAEICNKQRMFSSNNYKFAVTSETFTKYVVGGSYVPTNKWGETSNKIIRELPKLYSADGLTELQIVDDAARVNMGGLWRIPNEEQWTELMLYCRCITTLDYPKIKQKFGVDGMVFCNTGEQGRINEEWNEDDALLAFNEHPHILIPYAPSIQAGDGEVATLDNNFIDSSKPNGYYWTRELFKGVRTGRGANSSLASKFIFYNTARSVKIATTGSARYYGMPLRACISQNDINLLLEKTYQ